MLEETDPKENYGQKSDQQSEVQKGHDAERSGFEKSHQQDRGNLSEGYQPIRDSTGPPPDGGSGVPEKKDND